MLLLPLTRFLYRSVHGGDIMGILESGRGLSTLPHRQQIGTAVGRSLQSPRYKLGRHVPFKSCRKMRSRMIAKRRLLVEGRPLPPSTIQHRTIH